MCKWSLYRMAVIAGSVNSLNALKKICYEDIISYLTQFTVAII